MKSYRYSKLLPLIGVLVCFWVFNAHSQNRDNLPAEYREYTNPEEVVTFDRTTPFARALDVINEFAQKYRGKVVINRTETSGNIGISVPAMHWMDALKLILRVNNLVLVEKQDFYEIVTAASLDSQQQAKTAGTTATGQKGEGPVATTETHEVRINAIFFEGNRRALQEIGVDWSTISENVPEAILGGGQSGGQSGGGQSGGGQSGQGGQTIPDSRFDGPFVQVNSKGAQSVSQDVFNALINVGEIGNTGIDVQALFSAFEADNLGEILASPTVKVMNGQEGRIQVGQDFSIKQRDIAGNVVEQFFSVGTILTVTPQVVKQQDTTFIHLDISAERSSAQPDPVSTIINKQQAETQALLLDGETTVIAGLYNTEKAEVRRGVPILKDLPGWFFGLRYLFGYNSKDVQMRELVILLQASLEPTIPERYGKEEFRDKFEVLQGERNRMRDEIEKSKKILNDEKINENESSDEDSLKEKKTVSENEPKADEQKNDSKAKAEKTEKALTLPEKKNEESFEVADPEVGAPKVQLNLGAKPQKDAQSTVTNTKAAKPQDKKNGASSNYALIGGSFEIEDNAKDFLNKLEKQGYDASIIEKNGSDIKFVAYDTYTDLDHAKNELLDIKQNINNEAWIYRIR